MDKYKADEVFIYGVPNDVLAHWLVFDIDRNGIRLSRRSLGNPSSLVNGEAYMDGEYVAFDERIVLYGFRYSEVDFDNGYNRLASVEQESLPGRIRVDVLGEFESDGWSDGPEPLPSIRMVDPLFSLDLVDLAHSRTEVYVTSLYADMWPELRELITNTLKRIEARWPAQSQPGLDSQESPGNVLHGSAIQYISGVRSKDEATESLDEVPEVRDGPTKRGASRMEDRRDWPDRMKMAREYCTHCSNGVVKETARARAGFGSVDAADQTVKRMRELGIPLDSPTENFPRARS